MRVTICGHAGLFIETGGERILVDPCFSATMLDGILSYHPGRVFEFEKMPVPTVVVVTHGHFDHFHVESLKKLHRNLPVITAKDPRLVGQLKEVGFSNVVACDGWHSIELGDTHLTTTPSKHDEAEFGFLLQERDGTTFWHIADAEVGIEIGERLVTQYKCIDMVSAKYQPVVCSSIGYLRGSGARFCKREVAIWLEAACVCDPKLVFPYASGLAFCGRHAWFNRYAFPLSQVDVTRLLRYRLGSHDRATTVQPGDVIDLGGGQHPIRRPQASQFVRETASAEWRWEPVDTTTLAGLTSPEARRSLQYRLEEFMSTSLAQWLNQNVGRQGSMCNVYRAQQVVWQLVVHAGEGKRLNYFIDFRSDCHRASSGEHSEANFFTHISGQGLTEVLTGEKPGLLLWLTGDVRSYEKIMGVRAGRFWFPEQPEAPEHLLADPLTVYLRHFGIRPPSAGEPELPDFGGGASPTVETWCGDVDVLAREGENSRVMSKKVLLAYLALKEAERIGLEIGDEDIESASDQFRRELGLYDREATLQWLESEGLSIQTYSAVARNFAAVLKLEKHYGNLLEPLLDAHNRVARARRVVGAGASR